MFYYTVYSICNSFIDIWKWRPATCFHKLLRQTINWSFIHQQPQCTTYSHLRKNIYCMMCIFYLHLVVVLVCVCLLWSWCPDKPYVFPAGSWCTKCHVRTWPPHSLILYIVLTPCFLPLNLRLCTKTMSSMVIHMLFVSLIYYKRSSFERLTYRLVY